MKCEISVRAELVEAWLEEGTLRQAQGERIKKLRLHKAGSIGSVSADLNASSMPLQCPSVLNSLSHMSHLHFGSARQICNRACHFQAAVNTAARPAKPGGCGV